MSAPTYYVLIFGNPGSGTFKLGVTGTTLETVALAPTAAPADIQAALVSIVGTGNVTVTGPTGGPWAVTFTSAAYVLVGDSTGLPAPATVSVQTSDALTWTGDVQFTNTTDYMSTGIATATFTPSGGISNLPALVDGQPGVSPTLTFATPTAVAAGSPPTISQTLTAPGGPGTPSAYSITMGIPTGATGAAGPTATVATASDVEGSTADGSTLIWSATDSKFKIQPVWVPQLFSCQSFTAFTGTSTQQTVATIGIPAMPFAWRARVVASAQLSGTVNTHLDLAVRIGDPTSGAQCGYAQGVTGAATQTLTVISANGASIAGSSTYAEVAAGATATLYLVALQTASTTDSWSVSTAHAAFEIDVMPLS